MSITFSHHPLARLVKILTDLRMVILSTGEV